MIPTKKDYLETIQKALKAIPTAPPEAKTDLAKLACQLSQEMNTVPEEPAPSKESPLSDRIFNIAYDWISANFQIESGHYAIPLQGAEHLANILEVHIQNQIGYKDLIAQTAKLLGKNRATLRGTIVLFMETNRNKHIVPETNGGGYKTPEIQTFLCNCIGKFRQDCGV